jgi:hypothetical protein
MERGEWGLELGGGSSELAASGSVVRAGTVEALRAALWRSMARMIGATFMKLGRAPATNMSLSGWLIETAKLQI